MTHGPRTDRALVPSALVDVAMFVVFGFVVAATLPALLLALAGEPGVGTPTPSPRGEDAATQVFVTVAIQGLFIAAIVALLRLRGLGFEHIGLRRPAGARWFAGWTALIAAGLMGLAFASEALGLERDFGRFDALRDDLALTLFSMFFYGVLSAGFYEEILYRGYLMHRLADSTIRSPAGWALGIVVQAALFGFAHLHQGVEGAVYTGVVAALLGLVYVTWVRNLWVLVAAHGLYDALRLLWFHWQLTYGGVESLVR